MGIVDDILKINRENAETVKTPKPWQMFDGILDCAHYASERYGVKSIKELTPNQYSHACAEYITALIEYTTEFYRYTKSHE